MPDHVRRGVAFEKRFLAWFTAERLLGQTVTVQQVRNKVVATGRERLRGPIKDEHDQPVLDSAGNRMEGLLPDVYSGRKGRIDVLVVVEADGETIMVIIELKSTDWTRMRPENVRRNVARHAAQLYSYQGHLTRGMWDTKAQEWVWSAGVDAVQMFLVYEYKPAADVATEVEELYGQDAVQVVWWSDLNPAAEVSGLGQSD